MVGEARGPGWYRYDGNVTNFLAELIAGTIAVPMLPGELFRGWMFVPLERNRLDSA